MEKDTKNRVTDYKTLLYLVDGASIIIELWKPKTPSQIKWKRKWLEDARHLLSTSV